MPQVKIEQITFMCPTGLGNPGAPCRFHRASDNLPADNKCPTCKLVLVKSILPQDKITKTVMGEEDIEEEILERDEIIYRQRREKEVVDTIGVMKEHNEILTPSREQREKTARLEKVGMEIEKLKQENFFLKTLAQVNTYRNKRKLDIQQAILKAREFEDK